MHFRLLRAVKISWIANMRSHFRGNLEVRNCKTLSRLTLLKNRLEKDCNFKDKYVSIVESYTANGHDEFVDFIQIHP